MPFGLREMGSISRFPANTIHVVESRGWGKRLEEEEEEEDRAYGIQWRGSWLPLMPFGYGERTVSRGYGAQVYALSRLGYKTEAVISSVAPAHPTSPLRFSAFLCNACVRWNGEKHMGG